MDQATLDTSIKQPMPTHAIFLDVNDYLPEQPKTANTGWSLALNVLASFKAESEVTAKGALILEYVDDRGPHRVLVENAQIEDEQNLFFSNLIQFPVRGEVKEISLKLAGFDPDLEISPEVVHINIEPSRSFVDGKPMSKQ